MSKKLCHEDRQFIKNNWNTITNTEIAKILGVTKQTITITARKLNLKDKREIKEEAEVSGKNLEEVKKYKISSEAVREAEGREKTSNLSSLKEHFNLGQELKFKTFDGLNTRRIVEGRIIQKTDYLVVVKAKNEIISLAYRDFYTRKTIII